MLKNDGNNLIVPTLVFSTHDYLKSISKFEETSSFTFRRHAPKTLNSPSSVRLIGYFSEEPNL